MKRAGKNIIKLIVLVAVLLTYSRLYARNDRDTIGIGSRILFSENRGQWDDRVLFRSRMHTATLFAENDCFTFVVQHGSMMHHPPTPGGADTRAHAYRLRFDGSKCSSVEGTDRQEGHENYFLGRDSKRWVSDVGIFGSLLYHNLYNGIDMKVYAASGAMKYDFIVDPGADPSQIGMSYEGVDGLRIRDGNIIVHTSVVDIVELRPYAYQMEGDNRTEVKANYVLKDGRVSFALGPYDTTKTLIIDPYLYFSSYTGSTADNWGTTGCYDSYKNTYTSGVVFGAGYPVSMGAFDMSYNANCDIGIFKFNPDGSARLYATYLGGVNADMPHSMFVNSMDELVIFGTTGSPDFPVTPNAFDTSFNGGPSLQYEGSNTINFPLGSDIFICRFSNDGSELQASTFVGGSGNDGLNYRNFAYPDEYALIMLGNDSLYYNYGDGARGEIITDDLNNIYVGSTTSSTDFPVTPGCIQSYNRGRQEGVVFKIDYNLSNMMWSTYLGGGKDDAIYSVDCDRNYNVVVCGGTNSLNFPTTTGSYHTTYYGGSADAFVTKISYYGKSMIASTLFGSSTYDQSYFVRCGKYDDIFIFGQTKASGSTLIHNANWNTPNSGQFLARFKPNLDTLVWSTVFGDGSGQPNISPTAFAVDICNRIYLSGWGRYFLGRSFNGTVYQWNTVGTSNLTVTSDAFQSTTDGQDFYIMSVDVNANNLVFASFFGEPHNSSEYYSGGDHVDGGTSRFDRHGTLYQAVCASCSGGDNFPVTTGAYGQHNNSSNCNNAIFRINLTDDFPVADFIVPGSICAYPFSGVTFHNLGRGDHFKWIFGDGTELDTTYTQYIYHGYPNPGLYNITQIAYMPGGCRESDTITHQLMVLGRGQYSLDTLSTCPGIQLQIGMSPLPYLNYRWIAGNVSDSTISNPVVTQPGTYTMVISSQLSTEGNCYDTVTQVVVVGETEAHIVGDSVTCSIPSTLDINAEGNGLTYQWSSNRDLSDTLNTDLSDGHLTFIPTGLQWLYMHVVNELGCYKTDSIQVRLRRVVDSVVVVDPTCPGDCNGTATLFSSSTAQPFQYNWISGWGSSDSYNGFCAGSYNVIFRDADGCTVTTPFTVTDPLPPDVADSVTHIHCHETCTGEITVYVNGPSTYSLLWLDDSSTSTTRTDLCAGTYTLQLIDSNGCIFLHNVQVLDNVDMAVTISQSQNSCMDLCSGTATAAASGGIAPYTYVWSSGEQGATAVELCEGTAVVVATDAYGCEVRDSVVISVQHSFDNINVWADNEYVFNGGSTTLHVTEIPNSSCYWTPSSLLNNPSSTSPTATLTDTTTFVVTLTDSIGCSYSDSVTVACVSVTCGKPNIFIPNAFTPNNDNKNDRLCFSGDWINTFHIAIFTRWGEKVYESDDITECWDGRYNGNWCMPGVYVYHCRITCDDGQVTQLKGDITLIR